MITAAADAGTVQVSTWADGYLLARPALTPRAARNLAARLLDAAAEAETQEREMNAWNAALAATLAEEGGLVDHPSDPGGITNHGVSIRFAGSIGLDVDGDGRTTAADIRALTREQAAQIYREHFWEPARCDALPPAVALAHFDAAVNAGLRRAARLLQAAVGSPTDGVIGPATLRAVRAQPVASVVTDMVDARMEWQRTLAGAATFGRGWRRRCLRIHAAAWRMI